MQQDYAYGISSIICDDNLNQMKGHYNKKCPIHNVLRWATNQTADIRRTRGSMSQTEHAQRIIDTEMTFRLMIFFATPPHLRQYLSFGRALHPDQHCATCQNFPTTECLNKQSVQDCEIFNLCLDTDGCVTLLNTTLPLFFLDLCFGKEKKVADIEVFRQSILREMRQIDLSCAAYDNPKGTQSGNRDVVDTLAKDMHKSMTRSDFYMIMLKSTGLSIELNFTHETRSIVYTLYIFCLCC